ncbi:MAG: hypothetical protein AAFO84_15410 [Cyanobacteria bacterium J06598_1]
MSISELNHFMTYVLDGWMLFSTGFIGISFISFVSKRIQEDIEAEALSQADSATVTETNEVNITEAAESSVVQTITAAPEAITPEAVVPEPTQPEPKQPKAESPKPPSEKDNDAFTDPLEPEEVDEEVVEAARLKEVAAVSEELAKTKAKQSDTSSVSVST